MSEEEKSSGEKKKGLSMPVLIAIIAGVVVILFIAIVFVISIMMNNMKDTIISSTGTEKIIEVPKEEPEESLEKFEYMETGRITTNPSASSQFVVVNLGMFYSIDKNEIEDATKTNMPAKTQRLSALVRHQINSQIGDMDMIALQIPRDSLMSVFRERLKPAFKMEGLFLKDVILIEFIIQ